MAQNPHFPPSPSRKWYIFCYSISTIDQTYFRTKGIVVILVWPNWWPRSVHIHTISQTLIGYLEGTMMEGGMGVRAGGNQPILSNTYNTTHFWSKKEWQHLHTVLIVNTFSLICTQIFTPRAPILPSVNHFAYILHFSYFFVFPPNNSFSTKWPPFFGWGLFSHKINGAFSDKLTAKKSQMYYCTCGRMSLFNTVYLQYIYNFHAHLRELL